jgi:hypothetical protein
MDILREKLNKWYDMKTEYEKKIFSVTLSSKKQKIQQNMINNEVILALKQYNIIYSHLNEEEDQKMMNYMVEQLKWNLRNKKDDIIKEMLLLVAKTDNKELYQKFRCVFAEKIVQVSLKVAGESMHSIVSVLVNMHNKYDPEDLYGMKSVVNNICLEKINQFNKFGELLMDSKLELKAYDKWLGEYAQFIMLKTGLEYDEIKSNYERMEIFYFELCFNNIISKDKKNGPDDLIFLVEKIIKRANFVGIKELKVKILDKAINTGILSKSKRNDLIEKMDSI